MLVKRICSISLTGALVTMNNISQAPRKPIKIGAICEALA